jgi:hypothetical protein
VVVLADEQQRALGRERQLRLGRDRQREHPAQTRVRLERIQARFAGRDEDAPGRRIFDGRGHDATFDGVAPAIAAVAAERVHVTLARADVDGAVATDARRSE